MCVPAAVCICMSECVRVCVWVCIRSAAVPHPRLRADGVCEGFPASHQVRVATPRSFRYRLQNKSIFQNKIRTQTVGEKLPRPAVKWTRRTPGSKRGGSRQVRSEMTWTAAVGCWQRLLLGLNTESGGEREKNCFTKIVGFARASPRTLTKHPEFPRYIMAN